MTDSTAVAPIMPDSMILRLAREIAMEIQPLDVILKNSSVTPKQWDAIRSTPYFQRVLEQEARLWNSAMNTEERVKVKAGAMLEEWLPELYARLNDKREILNQKVEGAKLLAKLAGMDSKQAAGETGERVSITINLGQEQFKVEKDVTPKVIEADYDGH